jgi:hypothetical protein
VSDYRLRRFKQAQTPHYGLIATAGVSALSPIVVGTFAWAFFNEEVTLTQGKRVYSIVSTGLMNSKQSSVYIQSPAARVVSMMRWLTR